MLRPASFASLALLCLLLWGRDGVHHGVLGSSDDAAAQALVLIGPESSAQYCRLNAGDADPACLPFVPAVLGPVDAAILQARGALRVAVAARQHLLLCDPERRDTEACTLLDGGEWILDPAGIAVGDIDDDLVPDLVVARRSAPVTVCHGLGAWRFDCSTELPAPRRYDLVRLADFDVDGDLDLLLAGEAGVQLCEQAPSELVCRRMGNEDSSVTSVEIADLDGDRRPDILLSLGRWRGLRWCRSLGAMAFDCRRLVETPARPAGPAPSLAARRIDGRSAELVLAGWPTRLCRLDVQTLQEPELAIPLTCRDGSFDGQGSRSAHLLSDGAGDALLLGGPNRRCERVGDDYRCRSLGDPDLHATTIVLAPMEAGDATPMPTTATNVPPAPPSQATPSPWPTLAPTASATPTRPATRPLDRVTLERLGELALPASARALARDGERAVAYGGRCEHGPEGGCRSVAVLLDLSDPRRPDELGRLELDGEGWLVLDAALSGDSLYLVTGRQAVVGALPRARELLVVDVAEPRAPRIVHWIAWPWADADTDGPAYGGLAIAADHLYWGSTVGMQVYDLERPMRPRLAARIALPSRGLATLEVAGRSHLFRAGAGQPASLLEIDDPVRPRQRGSVRLNLGKTSMYDVADVHAGRDRVYVESRLGCTLPPPARPGVSRPCGSALIEIPLGGDRDDLQQGWYGLADTGQGLGAALDRGDLLFVAQGRIAVLDARYAERPLLAEVQLEREIDGDRRSELPYDLEMSGDVLWALGRVDDAQPAVLRSLRVGRVRALYLPLVGR